MRINNVIGKPLVTEKTMSLTEQGWYSFKVNMDATKGKIEEFVKGSFGVDVIDVKTLIMPGKAKRVGRTNRYTKTPKWKKAVVRIKEGQKIDIFDQK